MKTSSLQGREIHPGLPADVRQRTEGIEAQDLQFERQSPIRWSANSAIGSTRKSSWSSRATQQWDRRPPALAASGGMGKIRDG